MKKIFFICLIMAIATSVFAQEKPEIYDPELNGLEQIQIAIKNAATENKHVLVQVGGNWCGWCILFHQYIKDDAELEKYINDNYKVIHLNWSPDNRNEEALSLLEFPQRFGFPVFVILDETGKRLHTQDSGLLEEGKGYNRNNVMRFFQNWSPKAVNPDSYKK
ncbi:MAG: thioredoxin fold domain-containing protein [Bacteroidetes bacterium]|jgi:thioredoxin-related protein|nr:thioredoxin fold domain-containing protein [Bacteroidota bacterium]MBT6046666.1 thioredoxin fold domain-containing protein [Candidatus Scalindua sp.]MBT4400806.1 thioredoxin fold domain-containing protein [Bacteroidota bacterium]MBT4410986.1 thioredoxin fold domain-containing protein [Bacteroidota bacterium]MBT5425168.1 thioredoxin fold domain-containing protein [Bacteroidota bacterium]